MKPRPGILLVGNDQWIASLRACVLEVNGYCVDRAWTLQRALKRIEGAEEGSFRLMIIHTPCADLHGAFMKVAQEMAPDMRVMITSATDIFPEMDGFVPDACMPHSTLQIAVLLERIRILTARKRGPKAAPRAEVAS